MGTRGGAIATTNATSTAAVSEKASERPKVRVLYDFEYEARGKPIKIVKDEKLILVQRTNKDWWQVIRPEDTEGFYVPEQNTFYVPTGYIKEEEPLPDSTRFYVDKDKMFKSTVEGTSNISQPQHSNQDKSNHQAAAQQDNAGSKEEPKKGHDSFRSVIRKLSGNLGSVNDKDNKAAKPTKPSKLIKLRKNSTDSSSDDVKLPTGKSSVVPSKHKDSWESSAFGMCFGRDMKNADAQVLNPFQEELENALSNRVSMRRTTILDTKLGVNKQADQVLEEKENSKVQSKFENIHDRWEKVSAQVLKKTDNNFQFVPLSKIKEDAQKRRSASPNFKIETSNNVNNSGVKRLSEIEKLYSKVEKVESKLEKVDKTEKVEKVEAVEKVDKVEKVEKVVEKIEILEKNPKKPVQIPEQKVETVSKLADPEPPAPTNTKIVVQSNNNINDNNNSSDSPSKTDIDRLLINDKRKMWAIETLLSELMQSSSQSKMTASTDNGDAIVTGPTQLAQELHDMNASRRYENAEIQVNLLDNKEDDDVDEKDVNTKEKVQETANAKYKVESWKKKKKVFDFPPPPQHSNMVKAAPKSPTARSPKLLDEYNEANILNDTERSSSSSLSGGNKRDIVPEVAVSSYNESPSYSNISLRIKREKVPCKLKMPTKDFRDELQLTPSLEKLASEIKFLPASASSTDAENDKLSLDMDCPTTTLSQDSLRLYKRRSKSDGALNKRDPRRRDSVDSTCEQSPTTSASHMDIFKSKEQQQHHQYQQQQHHIERKYTQHETQQQQSSSSSSYRNSCCMSKRDAAAASSTMTSTQQQQQQQEYYYRPERQQTARYNKLNRKSRSLGDLDCSELDEKKEDEDETSSTCEVESRRRYKPVPKLRSKESLRRMKPSPIVVTSVERLLTKPVPAKRRVQPSPPYHHQQGCDSSFDSLSEIDIERSTAVGFKSLLRTSESGSEEFLQYKTFPATTKTQQLQQQHQQQHLSPYEQAKLSMSRSDGNVNLSRSLSDEAILSSTSCSSASPSRILDGSVENLVELPPGWTQSYDNVAKRVCFVNDRGDKWFSSNDSEGKIYFFEENSNQSSWALPPVITESRVRTISNSDWPQLFDGNMCILKEGLINKTKITSENGKKLRKAWSTSYAVLTELFLLFFKDEKTFAAMKMDPSVAAKPDITVDLNGAFIESADKLSNRKNVYLINTLLGLQVLIQWDNASVIAEWYRGIHDAILRLPFSQEFGRSSSSRE